MQQNNSTVRRTRRANTISTSNVTCSPTKKVIGTFRKFLQVGCHARAASEHVAARHPKLASRVPLWAKGNLAAYFHSHTFDVTLSLASVLCSKTPTMPASLASFPVALTK